MKSMKIFLALLLAAGLLVSCGGSSDNGGNGGNGGICVTDEDCDDGNPCTTSVCRFIAGIGNTCRTTCDATGPTDPCCNDAACSNKPVCVGQTYRFSVTDLQQDPPDCLLGPPFLDPILLELRKIVYDVKLPLPDAAFTTVTIQLPVLTKLIDVTAERNNGELHFGPVQDFEVDLGPFGVSCLVRGNAEGFTNGFGNDELRVSITLSNIRVAQSGSGLCILPEPSPNCTLEVISEGQRRRIP